MGLNEVYTRVGFSKEIELKILPIYEIKINKIYFLNTKDKYEAESKEMKDKIKAEITGKIFGNFDTAPNEFDNKDNWSITLFVKTKNEKDGDYYKHSEYTVSKGTKTVSLDNPKKETSQSKSITFKLSLDLWTAYYGLIGDKGEVYAKVSFKSKYHKTEQQETINRLKFNNPSPFWLSSKNYKINPIDSFKHNDLLIGSLVKFGVIDYSKNNNLKDLKFRVSFYQEGYENCKQIIYLEKNKDNSWHVGFDNGTKPYFCYFIENKKTMKFWYKLEVRHNEWTFNYSLYRTIMNKKFIEFNTKPGIEKFYIEKTSKNHTQGNPRKFYLQFKNFSMDLKQSDYKLKILTNIYKINTKEKSNYKKYYYYKRIHKKPVEYDIDLFEINTFSTFCMIENIFAAFKIHPDYLYSKYQNNSVCFNYNDNKYFGFDQNNNRLKSDGYSISSEELSRIIENKFGYKSDLLNPKVIKIFTYNSDGILKYYLENGIDIIVKAFYKTSDVKSIYFHHMIMDKDSTIGYYLQRAFKNLIYSSVNINYYGRDDNVVYGYFCTKNRLRLFKDDESELKSDKYDYFKNKEIGERISEARSKGWGKIEKEGLVWLCITNHSFYKLIDIIIKN